MITLDGSKLEGGGQLVRLALSLSSICRIPIRVEEIRANRGGRKQGGGLKESHLAALIWLAEQCDAKIKGAEIGSRMIEFKPRRDSRSETKTQLRSHAKLDHVIELKNPGSVWLIWQAIWPYIVFGIPRTPDQAIEVTLRGGTNVPKSMSSEYVQQVFLPICEKIGLPKAEVDIVRRGWVGSAQQVGEVKIRIPPHSSSLENFSLPSFTIQNRGPISKLAISVIAGHPWTRHHLVNRSISLLRASIPETNPISIEATIEDDSGDEQRLYILVVAHTVNGWRLGRDVLGSGRRPRNDAERQQIADSAAQTVVRDILSEIEGWEDGPCVDEFLQDQLVVFQALAAGESFVDGGFKAGTNLGRAKARTKPKEKDRASLHTQTVRWISTEMLGDLGLDIDDDGRCRGIGWNSVLEEKIGIDESRIDDLKE